METSIIVSELLFTFALVFVILNVATSDPMKETDTRCCHCIGSPSRGSNCREHISGFIQSGGLALSGSGWENGFSDLWLHLVPQLFGAGTASLVYKWNT